MKILKCERCGQQWCTRMENPYRCGKCKTPYWDKPRGERVGVGAKTKAGSRKGVSKDSVVVKDQPSVDRVLPPKRVAGEPVPGGEFFGGGPAHVSEVEDYDAPKRSFPSPPCPKCGVVMVDLGTVFSCGTEGCKQQPIPVETVEYQYEDRGR